MKHVCWLSLSLILTACNSGSSGAPESTLQPETAPQPQEQNQVIAIGPITSFGSLTVNGIRFETDSSQIKVGGEEVSVDALELGQVATVSGTVGDDPTIGLADIVLVNSEIKGPIATLDATMGRFSVLGQVIQTDANTIYDDRLNPAGFAGLRQGAQVEIHGIEAGDGIMRASRIEPDEGQLKVIGEISELNPSVAQFNIGLQRIDYSQARLDDLNGGLANGVRVEVKGNSLSNDLFIALTIEGKGISDDLSDDDLIDDEQTDNEVQIRVKGFIRQGLENNHFLLNGWTVQLQSTTRFENGTLANLQVGREIEVRGVFSHGVLSAAKVSFDQDDKNLVSLFAPISSISDDSFTTLSVVIRPSGNTQWKDGSDRDVRNFNFDAISVGDWVEVRGNPTNNKGEITADRVKRDDADDKVFIRAAAKDLASPGFTLFGVSILTNSRTDFQDNNDASVTMEGFFRQAEGRLVKARGLFDGNTFIAEKVELEDLN